MSNENIHEINYDLCKGRYHILSIANMKTTLKVMELLKTHYSDISNNKKSTLGECPLCTMGISRGNAGGGCLVCPWLLTEGILCTEYAQKVFGMSVFTLRNMQYINEWQIRRIEQLERWIVKYKKEIKKRQKKNREYNARRKARS